MWHSIPVVRAPDDVHPAERGEGAALDEEDDARPHNVTDLGRVPQLERVASPGFATTAGGFSRHCVHPIREPPDMTSASEGEGFMEKRR